MSHPAHNEEKLRKLREHGRLARSECGAAFCELVRPLVDAGVLAWERSAAGQRLAVRQTAPLRDFCRQQFPGEVPAGRHASPRVAGVARFRDSKALGATGAEIVTLRAWEDGGLTCQGRAVAVAQPSTDHGVFSFLLRPDTPYALAGRVALVENPAVFLAFEELGTGIPLAVHLHGRLSERLLHWLGDLPHERLEVVHFGDYDPVGLDDYRRLAEVLGGRAKLYRPDNLGDLFRRYANPRLLAGTHSQTLLARLRRSLDPAIQQVASLIDTHNAGLEQEALLADGLRD